MRIERLRTSRILGLDDVDWTLPEGPMLLFCEDKSDQMMLGKWLTQLYCHSSMSSSFRAESKKGSWEMWLTGENTRFHLRQNFIQQGDEFVPSSILVNEMVTGQTLALPEDLTLGDYLFRINLQAFRQGVIVNWPENNECHHLNLLVNNLRDGGDEGLSLIKVRASLAGAQKRMSEPTGTMLLAKSEYDALRRDWDVVHRQQEEERILLIEIKKLQENEEMLSERIAGALKIQKRIAILAQNLDYRALRQLQGELLRIEERLQTEALKLTELTSETELDWAMIETLREECLQWASLQEQVERLAVAAQIRADKNVELKRNIESCGYEGSPIHADQNLRKLEEERVAALEDLNKLLIIKEDLKATQKINSEETAQLFFLADMAGVTQAEEAKLALREKNLNQWQSSTIGCMLDRTLSKYFRGKSIGAITAASLFRYYEGYHTSNYEEFTKRLKDFRNQQRCVESVQIEIEQLKLILGEEDNLRRTVLLRTERLEQTFHAAKVTDFPAWLNGWEDYQKKIHLLALKIDELQLILEQSRMAEENLQACTEQLREKLGNWATPATDRDEILAAVFKVACQLRVKDDAEKDIVTYSQRLKDMLGDRTMEHLAKQLEPLADLEREARVSDDERLGELIAWQKEILEAHKQREEAEQRLHSSLKLPSLSVLDKKIEKAKLHWLALEDVHRAMVDAQVLLERSWQDWQVKFGNPLNHEMRWIISKFSAPLASETNFDDLSDVRSVYYAYRMALAQLSLGAYTEIPLLFSVGAINVVDRFWVDALEYFYKLSLTRQMILITTDLKLEEKLRGDGWSCFRWSELKTCP